MIYIVVIVYIVTISALNLYCCFVCRKPTTFATLEVNGKRKLLFALPGEWLGPAWCMQCCN